MKIFKRLIILCYFAAITPILIVICWLATFGSFNCITALRSDGASFFTGFCMFIGVIAALCVEDKFLDEYI